MTNKLRPQLVLACALATGVSASESKPPVMPTGEAFLTHLSEGLGKYWLTETAYGEPVGNFPTFRCNDGSLVDPALLCPELQPEWIVSELGRDYTRMKSRQTYAYGVLYHLTGDPQALQLAKAGVDYLLGELRDTENGGMIMYREDGQPGLNWRQRTAQDQAYGLLGLAMYYYLTRDKVVEQALVELQAFIFDNYRSDDWDQLRWVIEDSADYSSAHQELVAQLDQINAYMLLVTPLLPEPHQSKWRNDLAWLTGSMIKHYHSSEEMRFYGGIHSKAAKSHYGRHNDYGHTVKAYWMTYLVGQYLDNEAWRQLGYQGMQTTIDRAAYAYLPLEVEPFVPAAFFETIKDSPEIWGWSSSKFQPYAGHWEWNELDQAAITISLLDPAPVEYLDQTLPGFMVSWVDPVHGGVGNEFMAKQHHWKNAYHSFEHALVGYLGAQAWYQQPAVLHYALPRGSQAHLAPYYFNAKSKQLSWGKPLAGVPGLTHVAVSYQGIRP